MVGQVMRNVGCGIGQGTEPTLEEAETLMALALDSVEGAVAKYRNAKSLELAVGPELIAHRAQVIANLTGEFAHAAYTLQRAAYAKATK
jgi:hypothetical protein